ncbi:MAG: hypothetical protein K0S68_786 [Candidatus Saccharibacteria bacterium]|jgi:hypothetical protein|nr:hypothetical protein [Candidatus Saccharibacteria bacterium]
MRRSTVTLSILLTVVTLAGAIGCFVLWNQYQTALEEKTQLESDLISIRNSGGSGGGDTLGVSDSTGDVSPGGASTGTGSGASSNTKTMMVKDFGIKFTISNTLTDLTYAESPPASGILNLTTKTLSDKYPCAGAGILGALFRYPKGTPLPAGAAKASKMATAGSYEYFYLPIDKNPCTDKAAIAAVAETTPQVVTALKTITEQ